MSEKTLIQYYIPEDGDELEHPNVISIDKKVSSITLKDIKEIFPIPGTYYFRFKRIFKKTWIWYDVTDDSEIVPVCDGSIMIKATRLPASAASVMKPCNSTRRSKHASKASTPKSDKSEQNVSPKSTHSEHKSASPVTTEDFMGSFTASTQPTSQPAVNTDDVFSAFDYTKPADPWASLNF